MDIIDKARALVKIDQQCASKSQRVMRIEQGMRPRESIHARKIERRAKHSIKGTPCK